MVVRLDPSKRQRRNRRWAKSREILSREKLSLRKITGATPYGYAEEHLTPFGGVLPLAKLFDALEVEVENPLPFCWHADSQRSEKSQKSTRRTFGRRQLHLIAMFSYNLWRHLKAFANEKDETAWSLNTNATSRLQLLLLAAKVNFHSERTEIKYSTYLLVKPTLDHLFQRLDHLRAHREIWRKPLATTTKNSLRPREQDRIVQKILCTHYKNEPDRFFMESDSDDVFGRSARPDCPAMDWRHESTGS